MAGLCPGRGNSRVIRIFGGTGPSQIPSNGDLHPTDFPPCSGKQGSQIRILRPFKAGEDASSCTVTVIGAAKEGLIKQKTAEKAVQKVITHMREAIDRQLI